MNLVVVVDHSGSMAQRRPARQGQGRPAHADRPPARRRSPRDRRVRRPGRRRRAVRRDARSRRALHAIVDRLQPRGATNIYDGLQPGFELLGDAPPSERQNRVIFLSDGLATAGNTVAARRSSTMAAAASRAASASRRSASATSSTSTLMRGLAEHGAGNFYFLEDAAAATEVFTEELDYFVTPLALDIQIDATAGPGCDVRRGRRQPRCGRRSRAPARCRSRRCSSRAAPTPERPSTGRRGGGSMIFIAPRADRRQRRAQVADLTLSYRVPGLDASASRRP